MRGLRRRATSETLLIDAPDAPAAGGAFANVISNFSATNDRIDFTGTTSVSHPLTATNWLGRHP